MVQRKIRRKKNVYNVYLDNVGINCHYEKEYFDIYSQMYDDNKKLKITK